MSVRLLERLEPDVLARLPRRAYASAARSLRRHSRLASEVSKHGGESLVALHSTAFAGSDDVTSRVTSQSAPRVTALQPATPPATAPVTPVTRCRRVRHAWSTRRFCAADAHPLANRCTLPDLHVHARALQCGRREPLFRRRASGIPPEARDRPPASKPLPCPFDAGAARVWPIRAPVPMRARQMA